MKRIYCLEKNCQNDFTPSINKSTFKIYEQIKDCYDQKVPIILDNGCGTGSSSLWLAAQNPNAVVFGSKLLKISEMARIGFWMNVISITVLTALVYFLLPLIW